MKPQIAGIYLDILKHQFPVRFGPKPIFGPNAFQINVNAFGDTEWSNGYWLSPSLTGSEKHGAKNK